MIDYKTLQHHLDRSFAEARSEFEDASITASESASPEDVQAFAEASQRAQSAVTVMNEGSRAKHGITKAIIDGIQ